MKYVSFFCLYVVIHVLSCGRVTLTFQFSRRQYNSFAYIISNIRGYNENYYNNFCCCKDYNCYYLFKAKTGAVVLTIYFKGYIYSSGKGRAIHSYKSCTIENFFKKKSTSVVVYSVANLSLSNFFPLSLIEFFRIFQDRVAK